eukprot:807098-Rhodomonas_salina.7
MAAHCSSWRAVSASIRAGCSGDTRLGAVAGAEGAVGGAVVTEGGDNGVRREAGGWRIGAGSGEIRLQTRASARFGAVVCDRARARSLPVFPALSLPSLLPSRPDGGTLKAVNTDPHSALATFHRAKSDSVMPPDEGERRKHIQSLHQPPRRACPA